MYMKTLISFALIAIFLALSPALEAQTIQGSSTVKKIKIGKPVVATKTMKSMPDLVIKNEVFSDPSNNNMIDGGESAYINFKIQNLGSGLAKNVVVLVSLKNEIRGLNYTKRIEVGNILPNAVKDVSVQLKSGMDIPDALAEFKIEVTEADNFDAYPLEMKIETQPFQPPNLVVADAVFSTSTGGKIIKNYPIQLKVLMQNIGKGDAKEANISFLFPNPYCVVMGDTNRYSFGIMKPGETKELDFIFTVQRKYTQPTIPVNIKITESTGKFAHDSTVAVKIDQDLVAQNNVVINAIATPEIAVTKASLSSEVDKNIPENPQKNKNKFALIIGNEEYTKYQGNISSEMNVAFARNDANMFKEYLVKTLGYPEDNVLIKVDAQTGEMKYKLDLITKMASANGPESELLFYYAGHGLPDETTHIPYLIPTDVSSSNIYSAIKLSDIEKQFSECGAKKITLILDACFTGGGRGSGLLAARSVKVKPTEEELSGNIVVFSATSGEQSALPYSKEKHGMFTFFFLKKLQESKGNISYKELSDYLIKNVGLESLKVNEKEQTPTVSISSDVKDTWGTWKLR